jgi:hypothetical protein
MAWINIETIDACIAFGGMLSLPEMDELSGIVMGWVDLPALWAWAVLPQCPGGAERLKLRSDRQ